MAPPSFEVLRGVKEGSIVDVKFLTRQQSTLSVNNGLSHLVRVLYECVWASLPFPGKNEALNCVNFAALVEELAKDDARVPEELTDIFSQIWLELSEDSAETDKDARDKFVELVCKLKPLIPDNIVHTRFPLSLLEQCGLGSRQILEKKMVRFKTNLWYKQPKFNLFHEESEGYAKLITELLESGGPDCLVDEVRLDTLKHKILSLVGCFRLDPNRVLDVILSAMEMYLPPLKQLQGASSTTLTLDFNVEAFLSLLKSYSRASLTALLGFKFRHFQEVESLDETPESLYCLCSVLLLRNVVSLEEMYPHLEPSDKETCQSWLTFRRSEREAADSIRRPNLNEDMAEREKKWEEDRSKAHQRFEANQKSDLVACLLQLGAWDLAKTILTRPSLAKANLVSRPQIHAALCAGLRRVTSSVKSDLMPSFLKKGSQKKPTQSSLSPADAQQLLPKVLEVLRVLNIYLCSDKSLFTLICRLLAKALVRRPSLNQNAVRLAQEALTVSILPALTQFPASVGLVEEVWQVLKPMPYQCRFEVYGFWYHTQYNVHPEMSILGSLAERDARKFQRRIAKTQHQQKDSGRKLAKISHMNPIPVMQVLLKNMQAMNNMITLLVECFKYFTPLSLDVVGFVLLDQVSDLRDLSRSKLKDDGINPSIWFQSLASFAGSFYLRFYSTADPTALLQYVVTQLLSGKPDDLLIVREMLRTVGFVEVIRGITDEQLMAQSGGSELRKESTVMDKSKTRRNPALQLMQRMNEANLTLPLIILIAQQIQRIAFHDDDERRYLKTVGEALDRGQESLLQLHEFIERNMSQYETYAQLLPGLYSLVHDFQLSPACAFHLCRSVTHIASVCRVPSKSTRRMSLAEGDKLLEDDKSVEELAPVEKPLAACSRLLIPSSACPFLF